MCNLFPSDDASFDPKIDAALQGAVAAMARFAELGTQIANGATRRDFPGQNADSAIAKAMGEATRGFYELRLAVISAAMREPCMLMPNPETVKIELQRRVTKNEVEARISDLSPVTTMRAVETAARQVA